MESVVPLIELEAVDVVAFCPFSGLSFLFLSQWDTFPGFPPTSSLIIKEWYIVSNKFPI